MQLDETFIAKAPVLIDEHDDNDEITVKKVSE